MDNLKVQMLLEAIDKMSGPIQRIDQSVEKLAGAERKAASAAKNMGKANAEAMESMGRKAAMMGAGIVAGIGGTLSAYAELEGHQARMQNAYTGVNGPSKFLKEINDQAIVAGNLYPGTTADFFEMATAMKQAGMAEDIIAQGGFKAAAALKVMFDLNPAEAGRQTVQLSKSFGIAGKDFEGFADSIQRMREASGMGLTELATAAPYISRVAKPLGIGGLNDAKQMLTIMGVLKQTGTEGSMVGTAIGGALEHLALMGPRLAHTRGAVMGEAKKILTTNKLDLQFFNKKGDFLGLANFVAQLDKLKVLKAEQRSIVGGAYFGQEGSALASAVGTTAFNEMAQKLLEQENLQTRLTRITDTLSAKTMALMGTAKNFAASLGSALGPTLKGILDGANGLVGALTNWTNAHPGLTAGVMGTIGALGSFLLFSGGTFWAVGKITQAVWDCKNAITIMVPMIQNWTGAMGPLQGGVKGLLTALGPLAPAGALAAVAAGIVLVATKTPAGKAALKELGDTAGMAAEGLMSIPNAVIEGFNGPALLEIADFASIPIKGVTAVVTGAGLVFHWLGAEVAAVIKLIKDSFSLVAAAPKIWGGNAGKGFLDRALTTSNELSALHRENASQTLDKVFTTMEKAGSHQPLTWFGAADQANMDTRAAVEKDVPGHTIEDIRRKQKLRKSMIARLHQQNMDKDTMGNGKGAITLEKLVDTINITSLDEATFTQQLLEAVKKRAPDLARELQRHLEVKQRGNLTPAGAHP